ncbi:uncharacterized protein Mink [Eurosta solidaginis]|uniref:uncharacterized protein Mink n=1 Tax=Eurosta solidaginis TaxID=178769 RepID=UPI003530893B
MSLALQDTTTEDAVNTKTSTRYPLRRNRAATLEKEVEPKISQYDGDAFEGDTSGAPITPSTMKDKNVALKMEAQTPERNEALAHTPRRSTRKSVKPVQEYDDIVRSKRNLSSNGNMDHEKREKPEEEAQKWTPAKVGRVSHKRGRKVRKNVGGDKHKNTAPSTSENEETEMPNGNEKNGEPHEENEPNNLNEANVHIEENMLVMITNLNKETEIRTDHGSDGELHKENETTNLNEDIVKENIEIKEDKKGGFGIYLKNNSLDMSDLGLNILNEDFESIENKNANIKKPDSPSDNSIPILTLNETSYDSDCIILNAKEPENKDDMQPLRFSDDETTTSPPRKSPRIVLTTHEGEEDILNQSAPIPQTATPKRYSKTVLRKPTPFKPKTNHSNTNYDEVMTFDEIPESHNGVTITVSSMEPKEIVLRSIRKRSWSVCIGGAEVEARRKNVTFFSPANQTTIVDDLDMRIVQSVKKSDNVKKDFVTKRRKRSLSFDEGSMMKKLKSPGLASSQMRKTPIVKPSRTKLPNFAAIHQKQFEKMENLVDHVSRKAERAKILTNSAAKNRIAAEQKSVPPTNRTPAVEKPKAMKRINLHNNSVNTTFTEKSTKAMHIKAADVTCKEHKDLKLPVPQIAVLKPLPSNTGLTHEEDRTLKLPNPRLGIIKPHTITKFTSCNNKHPTPAKNAVMKSVRTRQPSRAAFNLSTALESFANVSNAKSSCSTIGVPVNTVAKTSKANIFTTTATALTTIAQPAVSFDAKMASRRQRRMDMFKGRGGPNANTQRKTPGTAENNYSHHIRGVRSNRRFELQMAHRKNMEH